MRGQDGWAAYPSPAPALRAHVDCRRAPTAGKPPELRPRLASKGKHPQSGAHASFLRLLLSWGVFKVYGVRLAGVSWDKNMHSGLWF